MGQKRVDIKTGFLCNNNCYFCVQAHKKQFGNRPTGDIKKDLQAAVKTKCSGAVFTGGECTIRDDIVELVKYAKKLGFKTIQLQTNARALSYKDFCLRLIKAGANEFAPAVHGHNAKLHDYLTRSPGSFEQTTQAIRNLKELDQFVITNTVVVKPNYRYISQIAKLLVKLGVDQFQFAFVHAMGNAMTYFDKMMPRVSLAAPYIMKGLQTGIDSGKRVMAEAMPPCTMPGYERYCSELFIPETEIRDINSYDSDFSKTRKTEGKIKFSWCGQCVYDKNCEGPWKEYPEKMGDREFRPVGKNAKLKNIKANCVDKKSKICAKKADYTAKDLSKIYKFPPGFKQLLDDMFEKDNYNFCSLVLVIYGNKKISRMCLSAQEISLIKPFLDYFGVKYRAIPRALTCDAFYFESNKTANKYQLEDCDIKILKIKNQYLYLSYDKKIIDKLVAAEISGAYDVGLILGYPKCCVDFYKSNSVSSVSDVYMWNRIVTASSSDGPYEYTINTLRLNRTILLHFPCSFDCQKSKRLGRDYFRTFSRVDGRYARIYQEDLKKPVFLSKKFLINFEKEEISLKNKFTGEFHTKGIIAKRITKLFSDRIIVDGKAYLGRLVKFK